MAAQVVCQSQAFLTEANLKMDAATMSPGVVVAGRNGDRCVRFNDCVEFLPVDHDETDQDEERRWFSVSSFGVTPLPHDNYNTGHLRCLCRAQQHRGGLVFCSTALSCNACNLSLPQRSVLYHTWLYCTHHAHLSPLVFLVVTASGDCLLPRRCHSHSTSCQRLQQQRPHRTRSTA